MEFEPQNSQNPESLCRHQQEASWQAQEQASPTTSPHPKPTVLGAPVPSLLETGRQGYWSTPGLQQEVGTLPQVHGTTYQGPSGLLVFG